MYLKGNWQYKHTNMALFISPKPMFSAKVTYDWISNFLIKNKQSNGNVLRGIVRLAREITLSKLFLHSMSVKVYLRKREFAPWGILFFPFCSEEAKKKAIRKSQKMSLFVKITENLSNLSIPVNTTAPRMILSAMGLR